MKFKEERSFASPEAAEKKWLEPANAIEADHAGRLSVAVINTQFVGAGGSYEEYGAAATAAIAHGWLTLHPSGGYPRRGCSRFSDLRSRGREALRTQGD